jgi:hypothetical protein
MIKPKNQDIIDKRNCIYNRAGELCQIILDLRAENAKLKEKLSARNEEIKRLLPFLRFYRHIEEHLGQDDEVICKICGKSLDEIEQAVIEGG